MNSRGGLLVLSLVLLRGAVACSDTPLSTPASDGNYDDEGAPGNMNDPGGGDAGATSDVTYDATPATDTGADVQLDAALDAGNDGEPDALVESGPDAEPEAGPDADVDAGD